MRQQSEIDDVIGRATEGMEEGGSRFPGMSYEEGVLAALDWVTGNADDDPMEE